MHFYNIKWRRNLQWHLYSSKEAVNSVGCDSVKIAMSKVGLSANDGKQIKTTRNFPSTFFRKLARRPFFFAVSWKLEVYTNRSPAFCFRFIYALGITQNRRKFSENTTLLTAEGYTIVNLRLFSRGTLRNVGKIILPTERWCHSNCN